MRSETAFPLNGELLTTSSDHVRWKDVSFDDVDYANPSELKKAQFSEYQHQLVKLYAFRTVQRALEMCRKTQGVNAIEDCRHLALRYMELLPKSALRGHNFIQRNDPSK
ncbi:uncharacterized protein V1516DRAFT_666415 [Lipomyces oligophaga]|uniref:uncharacterized protein n=1 Tax=Lipomyces oligophaga TaxID=45792 RepID=UPI0034CF0326